MLVRTPLLVAVCTLSVAPLADHPTNVYAEDATWSHAYAETSVWTLESMTQVQSGVEVDVGSPEMTIDFARSFSLEDTYARVKDGTLVERKREFGDSEGSLSMSIDLMGQTEAHEASMTSPLNGATIICTLDEESGEHAFAFESDGDDDLLTSLLADAEFAMLPPGKEVEKGDSWIVDLSERPSFFSPAGHLPWKTSFESTSFGLLLPYHVLATSLINHSDAAREIEGELEVTWSETKGSDGERLAVLDITLEAVLDADLSEELARLCRAAGIPEAGMIETVNMTVEGEGIALWDIDAGHLHSFEMELESEVELVLEWTEGSEDIQVEASLSGTTKRTAERE